MYGRFRAPASIRGLEEFDQLVFDCFYRQGMTRDECRHVLEPQFPNITDRQIVASNARIHAELTSRQRWQLSTRRKETVPIDDVAMPLTTADESPESLVQSAQDRERLQKAMARLEPEQRLVLQLRYQQDLTLEEVARLTRLNDPFHARRKIDAALAALAKAMKF
jgi:RNA polymerase sigma factor (sigma-70 family)